jgi:hypothetical protein
MADALERHSGQDTEREQDCGKQYTRIAKKMIKNWTENDKELGGKWRAEGPVIEWN